MKYDAHVGVEGAKNPNVHAQFVDLGFRDDGLVNRRVTWLAGVPVSSCPLIGIHMSKKYEDKESIGRNLTQIKEILTAHKQVGYAHSELVAADAALTSHEPLDLSILPTFKHLAPQPKLEDKQWDVHITIPQARLNSSLDTLLQDYGLDWIDLSKPYKQVDSNPLFRVYSAQGINAPQEGRRFYQAVVEWLQAMHVPRADCKMEVYLDMIRVGNPSIVPPVVDRIEYR